MKFAGKLLLLVAVAASLHCSDASGPPRPAAGTLRFDVVTPNSDDSALLLQLTGPALTAASITAAQTTHQVYARTATSDGLNVAVFGSIVAGPLLRIQVPDVNRAADYRVTFVEAADANNALRPSLSGYSGQVVKD
jgi:hypothetical protein